MATRVLRSHFVPATGQIAAGVRAGPGFPVGYLGSPGALTVLNPGDSTPGGWTASWSGNALEVRGDGVTIDHYRINGQVVCLGQDPTVTSCVIAPTSAALVGVTLNGGSKGVLTVTDTTVIGYSNDALDQYMVNGLSSDAGLVAQRCDVSGSGDGIHFTSQPDAADAVISQCYIHDLAFVKPEPGPDDQHLDGIQHFAHATLAGYAKVEHTYIAETRSAVITGFPEGVPMSSGATIGPGAGTDPLTTVTFNNNYVASGGYHLRLNFRLQNCVVTNNDFGAIHTDEAGYVAVDQPASVLTWSNNRDENGDLIAQP